MTKQSRRRYMERKIVELLLGRTSIKHIARTLHVNRSRIRNVREQAKEYRYLDEQGKPGPIPLPPYPESLFPDPIDGRSLKLSEGHRLLDPLKAWIRERLESGWHAVTVFEELPEQACDVSRSSFYRYLERHKMDRLGESYRRVVPEIVYQPGEALIIDWGKLREVLDPETGRKRVLWFLAGVLGYSRLLSVRLVWRLDLATSLGAIQSILREIKGVPKRIVSDNPKSVVLLASLYEPILHPLAERLASHYGTIIEALPPRAPEKKGKVERIVPYVRRLYEAHGEEWLGIEESQSYLDRKIALANGRRHGTTRERPVERFEQAEVQALKPLPALSYEPEHYHKGTVRQDGHVRFDNKYYSLDESHIGEEVVVLADSRKVSIYGGGKLLEVHDRLTSPDLSKSTKPQHLKPWERAMGDGSMYRKRALELGPHVEQMVVRILKGGQGFIDTRKIWGILSLDKRYPAEKIDLACRQALELGRVGYQVVRSLLEEIRPQASKEEPRPHRGTYRHVRPLSEYQEQLNLFLN